jgi:hypothetical protein
MAKKKEPEFPGKVYVGWDYSDGPKKFLLAHDSMEGHADLNGDTRVGIYELVEIVTVKVNVEAEPDHK